MTQIDEEPAEAGDIERLHRLIMMERRLDTELEEIDIQQKKKSAELRVIREVDIPREATACRLGSTFTIEDGTSVEIINDVVANVPSMTTIAQCKENPAPLIERRRAAYEWLRDNGHGPLVKHTITVTYGKGEDGLARDTLARLEQEEREGRLRDIEDVHYHTLNKWLREQTHLREDARARGIKSNLPDIPEDIFGVHRIRYAKVTPLKRKGML